MKTEVIYEVVLENDDLGIREELVIKDELLFKSLKDTIAFFANEGWLLHVERYDNYPPAEIDVNNC